MRVIAIGDIGVTDGMMHIGDEAMFEALVDELRARGVTSITGLSAAPEESAERYGIRAIDRIGFPAARAEGAARFARVLDALSGGPTLPADDPFHTVRDAVAEADGVVIAGGGNMASNWPLHIFERAALARIAEHVGTPLVITGQTLGPALSAEDRPILAQALTSARLVGLREAASGALAVELGVRDAARAVTLDDASFLGWGDAGSGSGARPGSDARARNVARPESIARASEDARLEPGAYTLVSLSTHLGGRSREEAVRGLARALDRHAGETGWSTVFHAHWGSLREGVVRGDAVLHDEVRDAMRTPSAVSPTGDARSAASLARGASILVTSRYHPAVFAAPAGVPILALTADTYTTVKLTGALGAWGQNGVRDLDLVTSSALGDALGRVVATSADTRAAARRALPAACGSAAAWWDRVVAAIAGS